MSDYDYGNYGYSNYNNYNNQTNYSDNNFFDEIINYGNNLNTSTVDDGFSAYQVGDLEKGGLGAAGGFSTGLGTLLSSTAPKIFRVGAWGGVATGALSFYNHREDIKDAWSTGSFSDKVKAMVTPLATTVASVAGGVGCGLVGGFAGSAVGPVGTVAGATAAGTACGIYLGDLAEDYVSGVFSEY